MFGQATHQSSLVKSLYMLPKIGDARYFLCSENVLKGMFILFVKGLFLILYKNFVTFAVRKEFSTLLN